MNASPSSGNIPRRRVFAFRLLALLLVPALVAAVELALQVRERLKPGLRGTEFWTVPDPHLGYRLRPSFRTPDGKASINAEGLRGDSRHLAATPGSPRILMVGNSCVFGAGCLDTEIFPVLVEERLRTLGSDSALVFNAGVGGYNSNQVRAYLERELWRYRPTDVVVYVGWNDLVTATWPFFVPGLQLGPELAPRRESLAGNVLRVLESSRLFWSLRVRARAAALALRSDGGVDTWNVQAIRNYRANLEAIADAVRARGVRLWVCRLPYDPGRYPPRYAQDAFSYSPAGYQRLYGEFDAQIRAVAAPEELVDLPAAIGGIESDPEVIYDYNHLGPRGHRLVADTIVEALRR